MDESNPNGIEKQEASKAPRWSLKKKLAIIVGTLIVVIALAVGLGVGLTRHHHSDDESDSTSSELKRSAPWQPKAGVSWQIILKSPISVATAQKPTPDVPVWDLDMWDNSADTFNALHKSGKTVICYFSAGSYENWRPDKKKFQKSDIGKPLNGWPGEYWLNVSSPNVHSIMADRIKMAAAKGCDALDPDNVDGYQNNNGLKLTKQNAIDYIKFLSAEAKKYNMSIGLKNAGGIVKDVLPYVAFSVNEQCVEYEECTSFRPFTKANKPVFNIEYPKGAPGHVPDSKRKQICGTTGAAEGAVNFSHVIKDMDLDGWVEYCNAGTFTTPTQKSSS